MSRVLQPASAGHIFSPFTAAFDLAPPVSSPLLRCATCREPLVVCEKCWTRDWWYLYCPAGHQLADYDHRHSDEEAGEGPSWNWRPHVGRRREFIRNPRTQRLQYRKRQAGRCMSCGWEAPEGATVYSAGLCKRHWEDLQRRRRASNERQKARAPDERPPPG